MRDRRFEQWQAMKSLVKNGGVAGRGAQPDSTALLRPERRSAREEASIS